MIVLNSFDVKTFNDSKLASMQSQCGGKQSKAISNKERRIDLDAMRIIACFLVVFNHLDGYLLYMNSATVAETWIYMTLTMITRINVPLFFMISGALLLSDREESYSDILKNRVARIFIALSFFILILYFQYLGNSFEGFSIESYIRLLFSEPRTVVGNAYWYLYSYMGFCLLLPFLRRIVRKMTKWDFALLISIHFLFGSFLPIINLILSSKGMQTIVFAGHFELSMNLAISNVMFYPVIGYYIDNNRVANSLGTKMRTYVVVIAIIGIIISDICTYYEGTQGDMKFTQNYVMLFDYVSAICVFVFIKNTKINRLSKGYSIVAKIISAVGPLTFGIYLMDPILKRFIYNQFSDFLGTYIPTIVLSILWCFTSLILGGGITYMLRKIKIFSKIL